MPQNYSRMENARSGGGSCRRGEHSGLMRMYAVHCVVHRGHSEDGSVTVGDDHCCNTSPTTLDKNIYINIHNIIGTAGKKQIYYYYYIVKCWGLKYKILCIQRFYTARQVATSYEKASHITPTWTGQFVHWAVIELNWCLLSYIATDSNNNINDSSETDANEIINARVIHHQPVWQRQRLCVRAITKLGKRVLKCSEDFFFIASLNLDRIYCPRDYRADFKRETCWVGRYIRARRLCSRIAVVCSYVVVMLCRRNRGTYIIIIFSPSILQRPQRFVV